MKTEYTIKGEDAQTRGLIDVLCKCLVECKQCGKCCDGSLFKEVPLTDKEIIKLNLADEKLIPVTEEGAMLVGYTHIIEQPCKFFIDKKCSVYDRRPSSCRSFPTYIMQNSFQIFLLCDAGQELFTKLVKKLGEEDNG